MLFGELLDLLLSNQFAWSWSLMTRGATYPCVLLQVLFTVIRDLQ